MINVSELFFCDNRGNKIMLQDINIQFWRNLVAQFFAPTATKRYCMSSYKDTEEIDNIFEVRCLKMCHQSHFPAGFR